MEVVNENFHNDSKDNRISDWIWLVAFKGSIKEVDKIGNVKVNLHQNEPIYSKDQLEEN